MTWRERLATHYREAWGGSPTFHRWETGPVHQLPPDFAVMRFAPHGDRKIWVYATLCMSQPHEETPLELHMFSPYDSDQIAELLIVAAHYHRTGAQLGLGHSVNFGRPWLNGSACEYGLLSEPYACGPEFEFLHIGHSTVQCLWLIPISQSEVLHKKTYGLEALEIAFTNSQMDCVDPMRPSVV